MNILERVAEVEIPWTYDKYGKPMVDLLRLGDNIGKAIEKAIADTKAECVEELRKQVKPIVKDIEKLRAGCCERDTDGDGNCNIHIAPGVFRIQALNKEKVAGIPEVEKFSNNGEWGFLPNEPCRFCHETGGVYFDKVEGPEASHSGQSVRCDKCHRTWQADSSSA